MALSVNSQQAVMKFPLESLIIAPVAPRPVSLLNAASTFNLYTPDAGLCQPTRLITLLVPFSLTPLATIPWILMIVLSGVDTGFYSLLAF
jgi:hypothetical protein